MTLHECLQSLAKGEISNTTYAQNGDIIKNKYEDVIDFINQGLEKLYIKFNLKTSNIFVELIEGKQEYEIDSSHMMKEEMEADYDHYLWKGINETYEDDLIKILHMQLTNGIILHVNDHLNPFSVFTPSYNVIQIPFNTHCNEMVVTYQASCNKFTKDDLDRKIELPPHLFPALNCWVAYQIHSNINTQVSVSNASKYQTMYENYINEAIELDSANSLQAQNNIRFIMRGWI